MKKFLEFIYDEFFALVLCIFCITLVPLSIIFVTQCSRSDIFDLEERCFNFYDKNNYILDECKKYQSKLEG